MIRALLVLTALLGLLLSGCVPAEHATKRTHLERARAHAQGSTDADVVGAWLLAELIAAKGNQSDEARKLLATLKGQGVDASLARAVDADVHGEFGVAHSRYLEALKALRRSARGDVPMLGWFVSNRLAALRKAVPESWEHAKDIVEETIRAPGGLGWRARGELVEWWSMEALQGADAADSEKLLDEVAKLHGCIGDGLMAGPFGRGGVAGHRVHFVAEAPAPWPARFKRDKRGGQIPKVRQLSRHACLLRPTVNDGDGVYYVQTFIDLPHQSDLVIAVQGAYALFVDDTQVLDRDAAQWGVWPRFGVHLRLSAGRHRILARLISPETSIRVLRPNGLPAELVSSVEQGAPYSLVPPTRLEDPNVLDPFLDDLGVAALPGGPAGSSTFDHDSPVARYFGAYLAHVDGQDDIASVIFEPVVKEAQHTTAVSLAQQAVFIDGDPIFPPTVARDLARDLRERAAEADPNLWGPQLWLALEKSDKTEPSQLVRQLDGLAKRFEQVPMILGDLAAVYSRLGWRVERLRTLEVAAERFPQDAGILTLLLEAYEQSGRIAEADALAVRVRKIDPTAEVDFRRALARADYPAAIEELRRIARLRKDREVIVARISDLLVRAGKSSETMTALERALANDTGDADARLALADARYAAGDRNALSDALVDAIHTGADDAKLRNAIELIEGVTDLAPFRRDGLAVIEQIKTSGVALPGTAARVLDYGALWIANDGSARMLEHEIIRVQSREGIARHVEQQIPRGIVLRMRTIKADGRIFEPELVAGKPTVTMPHLEVGDYIETEHILALRGASSDGRRYRSPRWFFREQNTSYHISEWVIIAPSTRKLEIETTGVVPEPTIDKLPGLTIHRWSVEGSVALPEEPLSAPVQEFLPSVRVGWGIDLDSQLRRLVELQIDDAPRDPRMVRIAKTIIAGKVGEPDKAAPKLDVDERARRIYRWVLDTVQPGQQTVGARIITGKSGDRTRAFLYLCRMAGIDARLGLVRDRLSPPPHGPFSKAETYSVPAVRVATGETNRWLVVGERFAPWGYLPSALRGQPAVVIQTLAPVTTVEPPLPPREVTGTAGAVSAIHHRAEVELRRDGSADMHLTQTYGGRYAVQLRGILNKAPVSRRKDIVEAQLLGLALPGGRVEQLDVPNLDALDEAVQLGMDIQVPTFARVAEAELTIEVPFLGSLARIVRLPTRETPLYISERVATRARVELRVKLPKNARVVDLGEPVTIDEEQLHIEVADRMDGDVLVLQRAVAIPAGRIHPADYPAFKATLLRGDEFLNRKVRIALR